MLIYFALGLVGFVLLVAAFIFGELDEIFSFDLFGDADGVGPFNSKVMAAALTAFGATGMLTTYYGWGALPSAALSGVIALGVSALGWWLLNLLYSQEASSETIIGSLRGRTAEVTTAIPADGLGHVLLSGVGGTRRYLARSSDGTEIPAGRTVTIIDTVGSTLIVNPR